MTRWIHVKPCGTEAAYRRHLRHNEKADLACLQAAALAKTERKARRKGITTK